jgi:large subunit ribosomal protein L21
MYAVVASGGKQERVEEGQVVALERLGAPGDEVRLPVVLVVDGEDVVATPDRLATAAVVGRVVGERPGPKIRGGTYKPKTNQRRRFGHRQKYSEVEILAIELEGRRLTSAETEPEDDDLVEADWQSEPAAGGAGDEPEPTAGGDEAEAGTADDG